MPADAKILSELKEKFGLEKPDTDDYEKISNVFSEGPDNPALGNGLDHLEMELALQMQAAQKRAMGNVLLASEKVWGVNTDADGSVRITVLRMMEPDEFAEQFRMGQLFKDPGAQPNHGEYTHRIQWYIISTQKVVDEPNTVLISMQNHLATPNHANGLWDCLLDRLRFAQGGIKYFLATGEHDFRSPEHFNLWMISQADRFPTLSLYLKGRFDKRQTGINLFPQFQKWYNDHEGEIPEKMWEVLFNDSGMFAITYALRKVGKTVPTATEDEMKQAIAAFKAGVVKLS